jgi:hypothetical protein
MENTEFDDDFELEEDGEEMITSQKVEQIH